MWYLRKIDQLSSLLREKFISFVGAGGKTALAEYLARMAMEKGKRVAITTTTKIWAKEPYVTLDCGAAQLVSKGGQFLRVGRSVEQGKLTGLGLDEVEALGGAYDLVLVEADGSKGQPLKYPADYEPVIPPFSDRIVVVAGLEALGGTIAQKVFRWELFAEASGLTREAEVTIPVFLRLFEADGLMKGVDRARSIIVLNKYDACGQREKAIDLAKAVLLGTGSMEALVASVRLGIFYGLTPRGPMPGRL
jgi:molybdenum cofactor cytidylyltransferase